MMDSSNRTAVEAGAVKQSKKRFRSSEEKRRIVAATLTAGSSVARVAQEQGVHVSQIYDWRKQYGTEKRCARAKQAAKLLPVAVAEERAGRGKGMILSGGSIEIELPKGRLRIVGVDATLLRAAVEMLQ